MDDANPGLARYRDVEKARVHVASMMMASLSLLAAYYTQSAQAGRAARARD